MATETTAAPGSSSGGRLTVYGAFDEAPSCRETSSSMKRGVQIRDIVETAKDKIKSARNSSSSQASAEWDNAINQMKSLEDSLFKLNNRFFVETNNPKPNIEDCKNCWYECQEAYIKLSDCLTELEGLGLSKEQLKDIRRPLSKQLLLLLLCLLLFTKTLHTCFPFFNQQEGGIPNKVEVPSKEEGALDAVTTAVSTLGLAILLCEPIWTDSTQSCEDYANQVLQTANEQDFQTEQEQALRAARNGKAVLRRDSGYQEHDEVGVDPKLMEHVLEDLMSMGTTHADISPECQPWLLDAMNAGRAKRSSEQEAGQSTETNGRSKKRSVLPEGRAPIYIFANEVSFFNGSSSSQDRRVDFGVQTTNVDETSRSEAEKQPQNLGAAHREDEANMNGGEAKDEAAQGHATGSGQGKGDKGQSARQTFVVGGVEVDSTRRGFPGHFSTHGSFIHFRDGSTKSTLDTEMKLGAPADNIESPSTDDEQDPRREQRLRTQSLPAKLIPQEKLALDGSQGKNGPQNSGDDSYAREREYKAALAARDEDMRRTKELLNSSHSEEDILGEGLKNRTEAYGLADNLMKLVRRNKHDE